MKSKKKQRLLAMILSMVLMLSASISALAEGDVQTEASGTETTENQAAAQSLEEETVPETEVSAEETGIAPQSEETSTEPVQESTEQEVTETPAESEQEVTETPAESEQEVVEEPVETADTTQPQVQSTEVQEEPAVVEEIPAEEQPEEIVSEATELKQEFTDENGNVTQTVTAYVPEGAFQATADQISMEVSLLNTDDTNYIKGMMEKLIPENYYLDGYVLYQINFMVNGEITEPAKAITISMNGNDLAVEDTQKAHVFYYVPEDPEVEGDEDQLTEVIQKDQLIKTLEESGQSTENIEDYDYSEITVNEENADTITVKGWESTIYGCYVEKEAATELTYEDDSVTVTVSADQAGIIPEGAELSVTPIQKTEITDDMSEEEKAQAKEINAQYEFTEEKLKKDSEENDTTMEGFLAYDICFLVDGEEVEPSGDVRVVMDFKEAAVPEDVSEDAVVTVKHLKEDEEAEDGIVVEDMTEKAEVQTTEAAEIQKVELVTENFSTYTVIWTINNWTVNITAHYGYLSQGDAFTEFSSNATNQIPTTNLTSWKNLNDYANENIFGTDGYEYVGAYIMTNSEEFSFADATQTEGLRITQSKNRYYLSYRTENNENGENWGGELSSDNVRNADVYYIYDRLTTVETINNATGGITMRMIDYSSAANGINIGGGYGSGNVKQGLLKNTLEDDGYPSTTNNRSLSSLFAGGKSVDNLFIKSIYDETGYYEYSSFDNYAYLNDDGKFTVYDQIGTPSNQETDNKGTTYFYMRGNFMPYNAIAAGKYSTNRNLYNEEGVELPSDHPRYNEQLYLTQGTNYYFGMYMEVNFSQPENGYAEHKGKTDPMIYRFNGDDDLWVYIDDVLVLDIGGIHDAHSGYIDFSTGKVHVECINANGKSQDTTIKKMYENARVFPDGSDWKEDKVNNYFEGDTFRDYTLHTMKMFYMERGAGASNLHMKFNLQTVPEGTIEVTKDLTNTDKEKYANVEFAFQVFAQKITGCDEQGNEIYSDDGYVTLSNAVYKNSNPEQLVKVKFLDNVSIGDKTYDDVFYLKAGETAQFTGLQKNRKYYVTEIGVNPGEYDKVIINGTEIISVDGDGGTSTIKDITSSEEEVGRRQSVTFQNSCTVANSRELQITKQMAQGQSTNDTFAFKVWLEGTDGSQSPYNGSYYLTKMVEGKKVYYHYDDNVLTPYEGTEESLICDTATNGVISRVPAGYTASITGILSGTSFLVTEVDPGENYFPPEKTLVSGTFTTDEKKDWADGEILLGQNAEVIITNTMRQQLQVTKQWVGADSNPSNTTIYVGLYNEDGPVDNQSAALTSGNWTVTFQNVDPSYYVKELRVAESNEQAEFFIDSVGYVGINEGSSIIVNENQYTVDYDEIVQDTNISNQLNTTIRNIQKWQIVKRSSSENNPVVPGAEFKLTGNAENSEFTLKGASASDGVIHWKKLDGSDYTGLIPDGTYTLEETEAPLEYIIGAQWDITVTNGIPSIVNGSQGIGNSQTEKKIGDVTFYNVKGILTLYYDNEILYKLPSAGGPGIFLYMIGGTLLLMAGSLMIYINRRREVLKK